MEKISRIIPSNARVTTVDLKNSGVSRPGMPGFGREQGISSVTRREMEKENLNIKDPTTLEKAMGKHNQAVQSREYNANAQAKMIQQLSDNFFLKRRNEIEKENPLDETMSSELADKELSMSEIPMEDIEQTDASSEMPETNLAESEEASSQSVTEDDDASVVGKNLDVKA